MNLVSLVCTVHMEMGRANVPELCAILEHIRRRMTAKTGLASSDKKQSRPLRTPQEYADNSHPTLQG
jgi:hypothetical protein